MPLLVVVSLATAAYGWVFDQVVLLVAATSMFAVAFRSGGIRLAAMIAFWVITGAITFTQAFMGVNSLWYFWIPFAFLAAMILLGSIPASSDFTDRSQSLPEEAVREETDL
jgi:hypothetical protein